MIIYTMYMYNAWYMHIQYAQYHHLFMIYNIILQASATVGNPTESLDVDSIPVTKLDLGISLVIG